MSPYSPADLATTILFTDPSLGVGTTAIRPVHIVELRTAVNAARMLAGLSGGSYTDATLTPGSTPIKADHVTNLRSALANARNLLPLPAAVWAG